jgi:hypothetical protein
MGAGTAAEMLILIGNNSAGSTEEVTGSQPALYRVVIVRMRAHPPILDYVRRRTAEVKSKPEIIRHLKRFVVRQIFGYSAARSTHNTPSRRGLGRYKSFNALRSCAADPFVPGPSSLPAMEPFRTSPGRQSETPGLIVNTSRLARPDRW